MAYRFPYAPSTYFTPAHNVLVHQKGNLRPGSALPTNEVLGDVMPQLLTAKPPDMQLLPLFEKNDWGQS